LRKVNGALFILFPKKGYPVVILKNDIDVFHNRVLHKYKTLFRINLNNLRFILEYP